MPPICASSNRRPGITALGANAPLERDEKMEILCSSAIPAERLGFCGHAVQFPPRPAFPRATWTLSARDPLQPAPVVFGVLLTGTSQGAALMHRSPREAWTIPPRASVVQISLTFLTARVSAIP
jgi:hypothetical protein